LLCNEKFLIGNENKHLDLCCSAIRVDIKIQSQSNVAINVTQALGLKVKVMIDSIVIYL